MTRVQTLVAALILVTCSGLSGGCAATRSAYYNTWEKFGYAKRERLVDNVKSAREEQVEAKQQFASALEEFKSVVNVRGGNLEAAYNKLNNEYEKSETQAGQVKDKITTVKRVAQALFAEWEGEVQEIKDDPSLQSKSRQLLDRTRDNYKEMIARMDAAAATMDPVLRRFKNRVLFIKSNLNAQAIASLQGTEVELGGEIENLLREMEASIQEADRFIADLQPPKG